MNSVLIVIVAGTAVIAGVLFYLFRKRSQKNRDLYQEDLTTKIETTEIAVGPPPITPEERIGIGDIDLYLREKKIGTTELKDPEIRIGRDPGKCSIVVSEPIVSKFHCSIVVRDRRVFIIDNDSTNGTYINNEKISEKELKNYDTIFLGKRGIIKLVFRKKD